MIDELLDLVYEHPEIADLDAASRRLALRDLFCDAGVSDLPDVIGRVADEIDGYGPLSNLMEDGLTTDILVNGPTDIWFEQEGEMRRAACTFDSTRHLRSWCERMVSRSGGRLDDAVPICDVRLPDGSRMHVVLPPVAPGGPLVSIRRFPSGVWSLDDLVAAGSMTADQAVILRGAVAESASIVVSGATGTGKTTLLDSLLALVPPTERVVVIEELPELKVRGDNRVSLVSRTINAEGRGSVSLGDLVRASLRMRPDRIVIGEVRGAEALPALGAMSTGHRGSMLSIHASSPDDSARRLVDLALTSAGAPAEASLVREIGRVVDVNVHLVKRGGRRVVDRIVER